MKYWKIGAYFGSIALAVTIGMFQVGNAGTTGSTCSFKIKYKTCGGINPLCTSSYQIEDEEEGTPHSLWKNGTICTNDPPYPVCPAPNNPIYSSVGCGE
jgi:hypothetical protein